MIGLLFWHLMRALTRVLSTLLFDLKTYGRENVPRRGGALLAPNHQSYLDPVLVGVQVRRPVSFMARSSLFSNPIFGRMIRALRAFPVRQGEGDVAALRQTIQQLKDGNILNIFPEGTRTEDGEIAPVLPGIALVVRRAGVPVVPVAIEGSFAAWPRGRKLFRPHPIRVLYGPPMKLDHLKGEQITREIERSMRDLLEELRRRIREENAA